MTDVLKRWSDRVARSGRGPGLTAALCLLCCLAVACQPERTPPKARQPDKAAEPPVPPAQPPQEPPGQVPPAPLPEPATDAAPATATVAVAEPASPVTEPSSAVAEPGAATTATATAAPPRPRLAVQVSEQASEETPQQQLTSYDRKSRTGTPWQVAVYTDRNAAEFPGSVTSARISYVAAPVGVIGKLARAMNVAFRLENQTSPFAGCEAKSGPARGCGCDKIIPYTYIALVHQLADGTHLDESKYLSFWAKSSEPFELHMALGCSIEARPQSGYLDAERRRPDPCWHAIRSELKLPDPIQIRGDDTWHRYQIRIDDLPANEVVVGAPCTLSEVTQISYVLKKGAFLQPGEYPKNRGEILFDDLEGLGTSAVPVDRH